MKKFLSFFAAFLFAANVMADPITVVLPAVLDVSNVSFRSENLPDFVLEEGDYAGTYFDMGAHDSSEDTLLYAEWNVTIQPIKYNLAVDVYNTNGWCVQLYLLNQAGDTVKALRYNGSFGQCGQFSIGSLDLKDLEAGDYKVRARAATAWSAMKLKDIIFEADYQGVTVALPDTLLPAYAELSANASITNHAIAFKPSTAPDEYATWNVSFAEAGNFNVSINISATNGHNYGVALLSADGETEIGAVNEGGQKSDTGEKELGAIAVPAAGKYVVKLTNSIQWSEAVLNNIVFVSAPIEPKYFLVGSLNEWKLNDLYEFLPNPGAEGEFMLTADLAKGDSIKVVKALGEEIVAWYPDQAPNYVVDSLHANKDKKIYFRPDGQGGEGWYYGVFFVEPNPEPTKYYLKNNWGGAQDWTWKEMKLDDDPEEPLETHILEGVVFGGAGVNINTKPEDEGSIFVAAEDIDAFDLAYESATLGALDTVVFYFRPERYNRYNPKEENGLGALIIGKHKEIPLYSVAEIIAAELKDSVDARVEGVITKMEFKGKNFAKYGSVNIYVKDATGKEGVVEFYNCYSFEADTFKASVPEYDATSTAWKQFEEVTDASGRTLHLNDTVIAIGKYVFYQKKTHELISCNITDVKHYVAPTKYYLVGSMNEWKVDDLYEFLPNPGSEGEFMLAADLAVDDEFKVKGLVGDAETWYPEGMGNNYKVDAAHAGKAKNIYFRPDGQGGEGWHEGFFFVEENEPDPDKLKAVSDSTTWDFTKLAANTESPLYKNDGIQLADTTAPSKTDEIIYADYADSLWTIGEGFDGEAIAFTGEYPIRKNKLAQNGALRIKAAVAGSIIVKFSDTGTGAKADAIKRYLVINGDTTEYWASRERTGEDPYPAQLDVTTEAISIPEGDVIISGTSALVFYLVTFIPDATPEPEPTYTVAGNSQALFGTAWDPTNVANDMERIVGSEYLYAWKSDSVTLAAGNIEFKVVKDHSWSKAWPAQNYVLPIPEAGIYNIDIFFNPEAEADSLAVHAEATKVGSAEVDPVVSIAGSMNGWSATANIMTLAEDKLTATLILDSLKAGNYEFKVVLNGGDWRSNAHEFTRESNATGNMTGNLANMKLAADLDGSYIFTWTFANDSLAITYPEEQPGETIPSTAPAAPTVAEDDVMAIYCNHYTTNNLNFGISGWAGAYQVLDLEGTNVGYWTAMTWECIIDPVNTDAPHDLSAYKKLHVDLWAPKPAKIKFTAEAVAGGNYKDGVIVTLNAGWNCVDLVVAEWPGSYDFKNLKCFCFEMYQTPEGASFEGNPFAFANIYFYDKEPQAIDNTNDGAKATKTIVNGQVLIIKNGKTYNVLGTLVK